MDAPEPIIEPIEINNNEQTFSILFKAESNKLIISIEQKYIIENQYSISYSKEELSKISNYFNMFDSIDDTLPSLIYMIKNKQFSINFLKDNKLSLEIFPKIEKVKNIQFILNESEIDTNTLIKKLVLKVQKIEKENKELREIVDELKNKLIPLKEEKEKLEMEKKNNFFKDSSLLSYKQKEQLSDWILPNCEKQFSLLYKLTRDGSSTSDFHSKCDNKGPTITIIQSSTGYKFGGYTSVNWDIACNNYKKDELAFLFSLDKNEKYSIKKGCEEKAIWTGNGYGPIFGGHDLLFSDSMTEKSSANYCNAPISYNTKEKGGLTGGQYNFLVQEIEVFHVKFL